MPRRINAMRGSELQLGLRQVTKDLERATREISGADSEPVKQAAAVLRKNWRRGLSVRSSEPAPPGSPPHRQVGGLWRSIRTAVVQGVRRIGTDNFRAWMHEFGTDKHPPRPHARPALEASADGMADVLVESSQRAVATVRIG